MKDYLYVPLGGSRVKSRSRIFLNLWIVFLISGLWHGAAWNFVVWGAFHGLFLILDRLFLLRLSERMGRIPSVVLTYFVTLIGWVLFRSESLPAAWNYLDSMFSWSGNFIHEDLTPHFWFVLIAGILFAFFAIIPGVERWQERQLNDPYPTGKTILAGVAVLLFLFYSMASITASGFNPFIYFRF